MVDERFGYGQIADRLRDLTAERHGFNEVCRTGSNEFRRENAGWARVGRSKHSRHAVLGADCVHSFGYRRRHALAVEFHEVVHSRNPNHWRLVSESRVWPMPVVVMDEGLQGRLSKR